MTDRESTVERDRQKLQDIFVSVTGETVITDRQDQETDKQVVDLNQSDTPPGDKRVDTDSTENGPKDAISEENSE